MSETEYAHERFKKIILELEIAYRSLVNTCNKQLDEVSKIIKLSSENDTFRVDHYSYYDCFSDKSSSLGSDRLAVKDAFDLVLKHQNKQICALLVDSYEAFESFLKTANPFQGESVDRRPLSQLLSFKNDLKNQVEVNLSRRLPKSEIRVATVIHAIGMMRHCVVHQRSKLNLESVAEKIAKNCGNKNRSSIIKKYLEQYSKENTVWLIEPTKSTPPIRTIYRKPYNELVDVLISFAEVVRQHY